MNDMSPQKQFSNLVELLQAQSTHIPEIPLYTFLLDGETQEIRLTSEQLDHHARIIAAKLQQITVVGERALLLYPPGLDYIKAFFGCLYAGVIAVPVYPPDPTRLQRTLPRLQGIITDAQPRVVLTSTPVLQMAEALFAQEQEWQGKLWLATDAIDESLAEAWANPLVSGETIAFLQYTSGSTSAPKGVMLTHDNLMHNLSWIHKLFGHSTDSQGVIWLPPYHDMGLIGGILQPLYGGFPVTLLSPIDFLKQPFRWLQAISRYKATTSGGPNFAYDLCVRKITPQQRETLDLSSWALAFNGAEPIRASTMQRFAQTFASCGFQPNAFYPCYGLAEATLIVSGGKKKDLPVIQMAGSAIADRNGVENITISGENGVKIASDSELNTPSLVGCGFSLVDQTVFIVNPETREDCGVDNVGEIWVSGDSVAAGYWGQPEATQQMFKAEIAGKPQAGTFLRTGDLGYLDQKGNLFVVGRLKDTIIIRGRNYYPQDIEHTVENSHPSFRPGCGAAFSVTLDGQEKLVILQEINNHYSEANLDDLISTLRQAVALNHEIQPDDIILLKAGSIPKTSSGKIQRHLCRSDYLAGQLEEVRRHSIVPSVVPVPTPKNIESSFIRKALDTIQEPSEKHALLTLHLQEIVAQALSLSSLQLGTEKSIHAFGLDSLTSVGIVHEIEASLGIALPITELLKGPSLAQLASQVLPLLATETSLAPTASAEPIREQTLSHGQKALWFIQQIAPKNAAYHIACVARLQAPPQIPALRQTFQTIVDRHPSLRTTFALIDGDVRQVIQEGIPVTFEVENISGSPDIDEIVQRPFDLAVGPLFRVHLLLGDDDSVILLCVVHHIVADFWSLTILAQEFGEIYSATLAGQLPALSPIPIRYTDYARWQYDMLDSKEGERLWQYWQKQLDGELHLLNLATDFPRPPVQTYRGATEIVPLGHQLSQSLNLFSQQHGVTLYTLLLSTFHLLLHRYTGQDDILVGSPVSARHWMNLSHVVGYCVNPLVFRSRVTNDPLFLEFLKQMRQIVLDGFAHQDYPFGLLVERLQPRRDPAYSPVFQAMFIFQQNPHFMEQDLTAFAIGQPGAVVKLGGLSLQSIDYQPSTSQFDLTLMVADIQQDGLVLSLQYNDDLFAEETIKRMLNNYQTLLAGIIANPTARLSTLPLVSTQEQKQLRQTWNTTHFKYPNTVCYHSLFAQQAKRTPHHLAVDDGEVTLTYEELNKRANQLAHYLRQLGAGPETCVGVFLTRGTKALVTLLGVLKSGAAYIPLDPTHPQGRIQLILDDAQASLLVTQRSLLKKLPKTNASVVCLDDEADSIAARPHYDPILLSTEENLAYLIYTSGSTGKPKGVQISHRALVNFLCTMQQKPGLTKQDTLLSVTTLSFDIAGLELFLPLLCGATLLLARQEVVNDGQQLAKWLKRATIMQATPATWRLLLESGWGGQANLKMLCGGEALPRELANQLLDKGASLWNMYGPTETTIWSAVYQVTPGNDAVPIGYPIGNTQFYILDSHLQLVPMGVPGEVYIGGEGLARGYFHRPALTAEKFVPHPFADNAGSRLYGTGDLGRYRADGTIEFLGRIDHQVKVRGFRIELGEIETALLQHPSVVQAVCVAQEAAAAEKSLVAYLVFNTAVTPTTTELRQFLLSRIPDYMVPATFMSLAALPLTPNGKVDRRALPQPEKERPTVVSAFAAPHNKLQQEIAQVWQEVLQVEKVGIYDSFFDLGGHSILMARVQRQLQSVLAREISIIDLFKYPTISTLTDYLEPQHTNNGVQKPKPGQVRAQRRRQALHQAEETIAIIGMSCRLPEATTVEAFWQNLTQGVESVSFFTDDEVIEAGVESRLLKDPNYVKAGAILEDVELFDAHFFGFNPREAAYTDPQHRIFLECAWEALEAAGYDATRYEDRIGVYAGVGLSHYLLNNLHGNQTAQVSALAYQAFIGNDKDFVPTRVSYKLDLRGPSVNVQTACSSSLVAVHLASQSLLQGECDMALAGGVSLNLPQNAGYLFQEGGIPSPDGHCRAFDAQAKGTVRGSGAGVVLLKRLSEAVADGDQVLAVIKGSAINNDGANKVGFTAPSIDGQAEVIREALAVAQLSAEAIQYVEAHGTGTELGDPIEIAALTQAFQAEKVGFCALGSVKTNIGHLDTAAGIAGLIKTVLALQNQQIPPSLNFSEPNPRIDFAHTPFYVNTQLNDWPRNGVARRAGVSSFGLGGTNAHLVVEEAPPAEKTIRSSRPRQLLLLSAKTPTALDTATTNLAAVLSTEIDLADVAYTLQVGRKVFTHRRMLVCSSPEDGALALSQMDPTRIYTDIQETRSRPVVFMFSGQGAQYVQMARELYEVEPVFQEAVNLCTQKLQPSLKLDLRTILFPDAAATKEATALLNQTHLTQPALFVIEYALAQLWQSWGIQPQAMIGHSIGEYTAACLAGVFSLEDALGLVVIRGQLMQEMEPGAMLAVSLPASGIETLLSEEISLAAINSPALCVVSGTIPAIEQLEQRLTTEGILCRRLQTSHAFHSVMMEPAIAPFTDHVSSISLHPPKIPFISNVSGQWITEREATDPAYWAMHLRQPVRFAAGLDLLLADKEWILLEVGPGRTLSTLARQHPAKNRQQVILPSLRHPQDAQSDVAFLLNTLGQLWLAGLQIDWQGFYAHEERKRVTLPTYPFERQKYWIDPAPSQNTPRLSLERKADITDWFSAPVWRQSWLQPSRTQQTPGSWLIFCDSCGLGDQLIQQIEPSQAIVVRMGSTFQQIDQENFTLNPQRSEEYVALLEALAGTVLTTIVHLWSVTPNQPTVEEVFDAGFYSLIALTQALEKQQITTPLQLNVISNQLHKVAGLGGEHPLKAMILGPCRTITQEYPHITCRQIDLTLTDQPLTWLGKQLYRECTMPITDNTIAYRGRTRWLQTYDSVSLSREQDSTLPLRQNGVYLITGGMGGIGLIIAHYLASRERVRLILCGRSAPTSQQQKQIEALKSLGAEILVCQADVTNASEMQKVLNLAQEKFGALHGVIHAAGLPGGGMIQLKTREMAWRVLAPKVQGTLVLHSLLAHQPLDFFWLFSSINALTGGFGQVDYCAANAFLDAFAQSQWPELPIQSINWDRWRDVGMAAEANASFVEHPLWNNCLIQQTDKTVYQAEFSVETHWVLSEHKIAQNPTVPGATYLEMVRAAFADLAQKPVIEIKEVAFLTPLTASAGEHKEILCLLDREEENLYSFRFVSRSGESNWQEHVQGKITSAAAYTPTPINIQAVQDRCQLLDLKSNQYQERTQQKEAFLEVGPRWQTVQALYTGHHEGLAVIALDEALADEVSQYQLHPALLDVATGAIQLFSEGYYLPLVYERLQILGPLPSRIYSYIQHNGLNQSDTLTCDISILNEQGTVLVAIQGFTMKRLSQETVSALKNQNAAATDVPSLPVNHNRSDLASILNANDEHSILPEEGILVLERLLSTPDLPQVIVSTQDIHAVIDQAQKLNRQNVMEQLALLHLPQVTHTRPDIKTPYVPPENEIEKTITEVLQRVLGIDQIGIHDNFFELGGTSLTGIQFVSELKKALHKEIPTVTIFEAPTVRSLAKYLQPEQGKTDVVQRGHDRAEKKRQAMQRRTRRN